MGRLAGNVLNLIKGMENPQRLSPCGGVHIKLMDVEKSFPLYEVNKQSELRMKVRAVFYRRYKELRLCMNTLQCLT